MKQFFNFSSHNILLRFLIVVEKHAIKKEVLIVLILVIFLVTLVHVLHVNSREILFVATAENRRKIFFALIQPLLMNVEMFVERI